MTYEKPDLEIYVLESNMPLSNKKWKKEDQQWNAWERHKFVKRCKKTGLYGNEKLKKKGQQSVEKEKADQNEMKLLFK